MVLIMHGVWQRECRPLSDRNAGYGWMDASDTLSRMVQPQSMSSTVKVIDCLAVSGVSSTSAMHAASL
jgi:hypothetical protein